MLFILARFVFVGGDVLRRPALRETRFDFPPYPVRDRRPCKSHATRPCGLAVYFDAMRVAVDVNPYEHAKGKG